MPLFAAIHKKPVYAVCSVSIAPVRREPKHSAEQTTQLLFGERLEIIQHVEETDWARIRCTWDSYEGWCKMGQLRIITSKEFHKVAHVISNTHRGLIKTAETDVWLPLGSELGSLKKGVLPIGKGHGKFKGKKLDLRKAPVSVEALLNAAQGYMQAPYQWGGRTIAGIDCSGLVQMAFKQLGIRVPRDAADQAALGEEVHFLPAVQPGDLAIFDNAEGKITHIGFLVDKHTIIHATDTAGCVVADRIDTAGIISISLKKRTHSLRMLRRMPL